MSRHRNRITRLVQLSLDREDHARLESLAGKLDKSVDRMVSEFVAGMVAHNPEPTLFPMPYRLGVYDDDIPF